MVNHANEQTVENDDENVYNSKHVIVSSLVNNEAIYVDYIDEIDVDGAVNNVNNQGMTFERINKVDGNDLLDAFEKVNVSEVFVTTVRKEVANVAVSSI